MTNGASHPWLAKSFNATFIESSLKPVVENRIRACAVPRGYAGCGIPRWIGSLCERVRAQSRAACYQAGWCRRELTADLIRVYSEVLKIY